MSNTIYDEWGVTVQETPGQFRIVEDGQECCIPKQDIPGVRIEALEFIKHAMETRNIGRKLANKSLHKSFVVARDLADYFLC